MSEIKLSEIKLLRAQAIHTDEDFNQIVHEHIPHLLELVERLGKLAELVLVETNPVNVLGPPVVTHEMEQKARALLKELEL